MRWGCIEKRLYLVEFLAVVFVFMGCSELVVAAEQRIKASVEMATDNDSNATMSLSNKVSLQGYSLSPNASYSWDNKVLKFSSSARAKLERFDNDDYNSNNYNLGLLASYAYDEKTQLKLNSTFSRTPIRVVEVSGSGKIGTGDVERVGAGTGVEYSLTERQFVSLGFDVYRTSYSDESSTGRKSIGVNGRWQYMLSERWFVSLLPSYSYVDYEASIFDPNTLTDDLSRLKYALDSFGDSVDISTDISLPIQLRFQYSEKMMLSAYAGLSYINQQYNNRACIDEFMLDYSCGVMAPKRSVAVSDFEDSSKVFGANIDYSYDDNRKLSFAAVSRYTPSSNGYLQRSDSLSMSYSVKYTERHKLTARGNLGRNKAVTEGGASDTRKYYVGSMGYHYRVSKDWGVLINYSYKQNKNDSGDDTKGQVWGLGVEYKPGDFLL